MGERVLIRLTLPFSRRELARRLWRLTRRALRTAFAERQILFRSTGRVRAFTFGWRTQSVALVLVLAAVGWYLHESATREESGSIIAAREREVGSLKLALRTLRTDVDRSQTRFVELARTIEAKHAYLVTLIDRDSQGAADATNAAASARREDARARLDTARQDMLVQLGRLETVLQGTARTEGRSARERLDIEERLQLSTADRIRMGRERNQLVDGIRKLEEQLVVLNRSQRGVAARMAERTKEKVDQIKNLIASTGVNVDAAFARIGLDAAPGIGGPFIASTQDFGGQHAETSNFGSLDQNLDWLGEMRKLAHVLPLSAPSDHYYVASGFGKRRDPFNRRWAMHYGVDLAGVSRSPILATAPGVVVSAGWSGNYGRMVEIDHGMGVRTRYGHLRRTVVKKGQRVELRQKIGEMGTSGRSTGTHLHYEVLVGGKPRNPMKFFQAGEYVLKGF
jgi:murein DD-endopeptidase MepM/ murein hydrolase activator NlpD